MTTVRVAIGPGVDAIQRVALPLFFGGGHPNYPVWQVESAGQWATVESDDATHAVWDDHRLSGRDAALCAAIAADPARVPADASTLDRAGLDALFAAELAAYDASMNEVRP